MASLVCATEDHACAEIEKGVGALIIAEELLTHRVAYRLRETLDRLPAWSDMPIIVLLRQGPQTKSVRNILLLPGDVTLIARPLRVNTFVAHVHSALRSRRRQYLVRDQMLELERSESRYRTLFNSIDEGFCIVEVIFDENDKPVDYLFLQTNPSFSKHTGLIDVQGKRMRALAPELEEHWYEIYGHIALTGEPARFQQAAAQLGRWYDVFAFRYGNAERRQVAILFTDITARKRWEDALRRSENKFATIFNSAPALVGITTLKDGEIIDVNESALRFLGYRREEVIGKTTRELGLWGDQSDRVTMLQAMEEQRGIRNLEVNFRGKSGQTYTGLLSAEFIDVDDTRYLLIMVQDITGKKLADQEIERLNASLAAQVAELKGANEELEAFNRMVSHDLRQPLSSMGLTVQALELLCGENLDEACRNYVQSIHHRVIVMNDLISTLLAFSSSTRQELRRETINLSSMARGAAEEVRLNEPNRRVIFRIAEGVTADGDASLLRVVLANLIGNAWKYTGPREEAVIEFGVTEIEGQETFYVKDNGIGFDMADADGLFAPFKRLPGADTFRGFGIGLATVNRIIQRHGGRAWATAKREEGATFYFTLP
ncbi:PAS domain S-box protein [Geomonas sp. RF6]|uniref:sensor histidine kinase n=1 Tax=Geomonas sp. RF6 TaxID=2897342 RepID=UPI001E29A4B0|nr:PAS domain S-box protein [Geomonas sp. RF6]UFS72664.1 PAS domain S-box protein [Geomonas sp. RF6]